MLDRINFTLTTTYISSGVPFLGSPHMTVNRPIKTILQMRHSGEAWTPNDTARRSAGTGLKLDRDRKLEDHVSRSVRTIERAVENFDALKENCQYFKDVAAEFGQALERERHERKEAHLQLADLEQQLKTERERALRAEERAALSETITRELEHELDTVRSQTERLVETISLLVSAEINARGEQGDDFDRLAA